MRPLPAFIAAAGLAVAAFHLIRWQGNGFCQVWDESILTTPWPSDYTTVSESVPTFVEALALKEGLIRAGACIF
jgi:hypothetical protein